MTLVTAGVNIEGFMPFIPIPGKPAANVCGSKFMTNMVPQPGIPSSSIYKSEVAPQIEYGVGFRYAIPGNRFWYKESGLGSLG